MTRPRLRLFLDGEEVGELAPPAAIAPREWILGVAAVQISVENGRIAAQLRAHRTGGGAAKIWPIAGGMRIDAVLSNDRDPIQLPSLPADCAGDAAALLSLFLDGKSLSRAALARPDLARVPPPRGFGHVFCRWLRDGGCEPGYDLTDFHSQPAGGKFQRICSGALAAGQVVSYRFLVAHP